MNKKTNIVRVILINNMAVDIEVADAFDCAETWKRMKGPLASPFLTPDFAAAPETVVAIVRLFVVGQPETVN